MKIINAWDTSKFTGKTFREALQCPAEREPIDIGSISAEERQEIQKHHEIALREMPNWAFFGGVINLGHRHFQVAP